MTLYPPPSLFNFSFKGKVQKVFLKDPRNMKGIFMTTLPFKLKQKTKITLSCIMTVTQKVK